LIGTTKRELQHLNNYHISTVERKDWIMCVFVLFCLTRANNQKKKKKDTLTTNVYPINNWSPDTNLYGGNGRFNGAGPFRTRPALS